MRYGVKCPSHSIFCGNLYVWALLEREEPCYGHESFIYVRKKLYVDVSALCLKRIGPGVVEIWGEVSPPRVHFAEI